MRGAEKQTTKDMAEMLLEHRLEASCTKSMREREQFWIVVELQVVEGQVYVKINIVKMFKSKYYSKGRYYDRVTSMQ